MTIFVCACGNYKSDQPLRFSGRKPWVCPNCRPRVLRAMTVLRKTIPGRRPKIFVFESRRCVIGGKSNGHLDKAV